MTTFLDQTGQVPNTSIHLSTRKDRAVENIQGWCLAARDFNELESTLERYKQARKVGGSCPVYNCHGLTFASRRTTVSEQDVPNFLSDDGFAPVSEKEAREGDLVVYHETSGEISHTGIVIGRTGPLIASSAIPVTVPIIWSKWGHGPEMVHPVYECRFYEGEDCVRYHRLMVWRDGWKR